MHSDVRSARLHVIVRLTRDLRTNHLQTKYVRNNSWRDPLIGIQLEREIQDFLVCRAHVEHSRKSRGTVRASFFSTWNRSSWPPLPSMTSNVSNFKNSDIKNAAAPSSSPNALTTNAAAPLSAITTTNTMIPFEKRYTPPPVSSQ
mmetsp:Transcript_6677/g.8870  ORF Transcript_6677/g.8870 Transcript_6677/m.8870 type:complete len:145 (-) Transcript_6677:2822-3256(-)